MTLAPGIHTISAESYHADEIADQPSLSASIASIICSRTPAHAREAHPKLNPHLVREEDTKFDVGNVVHALLLENQPAESVVEIIYADNWRTNAAKDAREAARDVGKVPLLEKEANGVYAMLDAAREQLARIAVDPPLLSDGAAEQTIVWEEDGVLCRALVDWLREDLTAIDDVKTAHNAKPEWWARKSLFDNGYDVQCAFHSRGVERLTGVRPKWRWLVIEKTAPYATIVVEPAADVLTVADAKVDYALRRWRECVKSGVWPAYSTDVVTAELPAWADDAKWLVPDYVEAA